jgi:hypothetical protein
MFVLIVQDIIQWSIKASFKRDVKEVSRVVGKVAMKKAH